MMYKDIEPVFFSEKRVHPAGMIFNFIKAIKDTILGLGAATLAFIQNSFFWAFIFIGAVLLVLVIMSIISWFRFTYRVEDGELRIEQGIFIRKKRYIPIHRIHKIDFSANLIHRVFKLVKVNVDTAGSGGTDASLSAVKVSDANKLREALKREGIVTDVGQSEEEPKNPQQKITPKHLLIAGITSGRAGFLLLAGLAIFSQLLQYIPESVYTQSYEFFLKIGLILAVILFILAMVLLWVIGAIGTMIKFGNFTIEKRPNELFIKRGLLETKEFTLPFDRIQAVEIQQSLIRQPFKFARITAVSAGGVVDKNEPSPVIFPLIPLRDVEDFLLTFVPDHVEIKEPFTPLPKKARKYFWFKSIWLFFILTLGSLYFLPQFVWIPAGVLVLSGLYGHLSYKESGYAFLNDKLVFQNRRALSKVTSIVYKRRIQALEKQQNKFEQIENLASVRISVIGLNDQIKHMDDENANLIADWYDSNQPQHLKY